MNRLFLFSLLAFNLFSASRVFADHLEEDQVSKSTPEHVFCGVNVYKTNATEAIKTLGKPTTIETDQIPDSDSPPAADVLYFWERVGTKMEIYTAFYTENQKKIESKTYAVEVWGEKPKGQIGVTGQGLALGDSLSKLEKVYGKRFYKNKNMVSGLTYVEIQWQDGTQLIVDFDKDEKIVHMQLAAETE